MQVLDGSFDHTEPLAGTVTFVGTPVPDYYQPQETHFNERTATLSIFDADLKRYSPDCLTQGENVLGEPVTVPTPGCQVFTLNRFNIDASHPFLFPRTVAYGAGLLNYFFRGQLTLRPPPEGVYALVDHATVNQINDGFKRLKVTIKNVTAAV